MLITGLRIINFKNYVGFNSFNLATTPEKNVILIGGMNGSGKTSLSESIRLCLYGNKINGTPMPDSKYKEYIEKMWSKSHTNETMYIEMDVQIPGPNDILNLTIKRSYFRKQSNSSIIEKLLLTRNGKDVELIDKNYWEYFIQQIIPAHISKYFFFDGEKTRDIIASPQSPEYLKQAIRDITEISKLEILSKDLLEVRKRLLRNDIKPSVIKNIKNYEDQIRNIQNEVDKKQEELKLLKSEKESQVLKLNTSEKEYNRIVGIKRNQKEANLDEMNKITNRLTLISEKVSDFSYSTLPKIIMEDSIRSTLNLAKQEELTNIEYMFKEYIDSNFDTILESMKEIEVSKDDSYLILNWLRNKYLEKHSYMSIDRVKIDLTLSQIKDLQNQINSIDGIEDFIENLSIRENLSIKKSKLEKEIQNLDDESDQEFDTQINAYKQQISLIDNEIQLCLGAILSKQNDIDQLKLKIEKEERSLILSERDAQSIVNIDHVIGLIDNRIKIQSEESVHKFEKNLNIMYTALKNKEDMVKSISVNNNFELELIGFDGNKIDIEWISEGEKGILMYSIMYGIIQLTESKLPLVIDSPLGRMDSIHVKNLISELYPKIGSQVIILSHDREISRENYPLIEPVISKSYVLCNKPPKVKEGYFK